jgi:hypothetical protein
VPPPHCCRSVAMAKLLLPRWPRNLFCCSDHGRARGITAGPRRQRPTIFRITIDQIALC